MPDPVSPVGVLANGPRAMEPLAPMKPLAPLQPLAPLNSLAQTGPGMDAPNLRPLTGDRLAAGAVPSRADAAAVEFEAAMLTSFIEPLLPDADSTIWGGTGASAWRGLFAQEVAAELARAGGLGIAEAVRPALTSAAATATDQTAREEAR